MCRLSWLVVIALLSSPATIAHAQTSGASGDAPQEPLHLGGGAALSEPASAGADEPTMPPDTTLTPREDVPALLDLDWGDAHAGRAEQLQAWASVALFGGRVRGGDAVVVAPSFGLRLALSEDVDVSGSWVLAYGLASVEGVYEAGAATEPYDAELERFEAGNPSVLFSWSPIFDRIALRVGLGFAIPMAALAQSPSDGPTAAERAASVVIHDAMLAMHGGRDPWRFLPERLAFFIPVSVAFAGDVIAGAIEAAGGWTIPVLGGTGDHEAIVQVAGDLSVAILPELRAGLRASLVGWGLGEGARSPRFQPSIEPWVRAIVGPGFVTLRATVDVAGDYGFGSGHGGVWAIHVGGGAALERAE